MIKVMNPFDIINMYYLPTQLSYQILIQHSTLVTAKAIELATTRNEKNKEHAVDIQFIEEAAMLHDIWIYMIDDAEIGCFWTYPYIYHSVAWYDILMKHGFPKHARVALSHTGVGITHEQIITRGLPLPLDRSYIPETIEEKIISYADLFFSKTPNKVLREKTKYEARASVAKFWEDHGVIFDQRTQLFAID
jgi:uncharacterized protein